MFFAMLKRLRGAIGVEVNHRNVIVRGGRLRVKAKDVNFVLIKPLTE